MTIKKIYVIAAMHGDELFGLKIIARLRAANNPRIVTYIGHPEAIAKKRRFLESDLNRSFSPHAKPTIETEVAQQILRDIAAHQPDVILDLHTSSGGVGKVGIAASTNKALVSLSARLGLEQIVSMPPKIAQDSLIGQYPANSLSVEFGVGHRSDRLAAATAQAIIELLDRPLPASSLPQYLVERLIENHEAPGEELFNYQYNKTLDGYPFLVGKNTYSAYRGFLAHKIHSKPATTL